MTADASYTDLRTAAMENNAFQKTSASGRYQTFRRLREFYVLDSNIPVFSALRSLWDLDKLAQPMLAFLCASARDPLIRASADYILSLPVGAKAIKADFIAHLSNVFSGRYNADVVEHIARNMLSSWTQSGHLKGRTPKFRATAIARPASTAYALYLGYLSGLRGDALFETPWARILDHSQTELHEYTREASARGWITYRSAGGITDVEFSDMIRSGYKEEHHVTH
jgi:hypothetical protein